MRTSLKWTDEMLATLHRLRASGEPMFRCAIELGVSEAAVFRKCRELGIAGRRNRGQPRVRMPPNVRA